MNKNEIREAIFAAAKDQGLTRYALAKRAGLTQSTLQRFEEPHWGTQIEMIEKILAAVNLELTLKKRSAPV